MPDTNKVRKVSILLQTLARVPGLGFLADAESQLRNKAEEIDSLEDQYHEVQRRADDVSTAARNVQQDD
jgi:hypothetical protein